MVLKIIAFIRRCQLANEANVSAMNLLKMLFPYFKLIQYKKEDFKKGS